MTPDVFSPIFPNALIEQEVTLERDVEIPKPVREVYRGWRPTSLYYAKGLVEFLDTPAPIFYK